MSTTINGSSTSTFPYGATFATTGGNVGIGTTTPGAKLSIVGGASGSASTYALKVSSNDGYDRLKIADDGMFTFQGGPGYSGVTMSFGNGSATLTGTLLVTAGLTTNSINQYGGGTDISIANSQWSATNFNVNIGGSAYLQNVFFKNSTATTMDVNVATGNVGIGTTAPADRLSISGGNLAVGNAGVTSTLGNNFFSIASSTTDMLGKFYVDSSGNVSASGTANILGSGTSTFAYGASFATSGGNVGIGTTTPKAQLHIAGNVQIGSAPNIYGKLDMPEATTCANGLILGRESGVGLCLYAPQASSLIFAATNGGAVTLNSANLALAAGGNIVADAYRPTA